MGVRAGSTTYSSRSVSRITITHNGLADRSLLVPASALELWKWFSDVDALCTCHVFQTGVVAAMYFSHFNCKWACWPAVVGKFIYQSLDAGNRKQRGVVFFILGRTF